jgi:hypothetical protein
MAEQVKETSQTEEAVEVEKVFIDSVRVTQYEDQFVIQRLDESGEVVSEDPISDPTMLDVLKKGISLAEERIDYMKARNAAYEGHFMAIQELQRQQQMAAAQRQAEESAPQPEVEL